MYGIDWATVWRTLGVTGRADRTDTPNHAPLRRPAISPVVWSLGFTSLLTDLSAEMIGSVLPLYLVLHLRISPAAYGVVDGLYQGFAVVARLLGGMAGDRHGRHKRIAIIGYGLSALCRLAVPLAGGAWTAIAAVVAADRAAKGLRTAPRDALISLATPPADLARAFGLHRSLDAAGALLGPLAAFLILWRLPDAFDVIFLVSFCVAVIGVAVLVLFVDGSRTAATAMDTADSAGMSSLLREPSFRLLLVSAALLSAATMSDAFVFLTLQRQIAFGGGLIPLLFVGVAVLNSALSVPAGWAADRFGRIRVFLTGHLLLLGLYAVLLTPFTGLPKLAVSLALLGGYYAATDGVLAAAASGVVAAQMRGRGLSLLASVVDVGRLGASLLFGAAWTWWGLQRATGFFIISLGCSLICALVLLRRSWRRDDPATAA